MLKHDNFYLKIVNKTYFCHRNYRECRDFDTREQFTSHKVGSDTRRVIVFDICQNHPELNCLDFLATSRSGTTTRVRHRVLQPPSGARTATTWRSLAPTRLENMLKPAGSLSQLTHTDPNKSSGRQHWQQRRQQHREAWRSKQQHKEL